MKPICRNALTALLLCALASLCPRASAWELKMDQASFAKASQKRGAALGEEKGTPCLTLSGRAGWSVKLDPAEFAGKTVFLDCEYKTEGISVKPEKKNTFGFKAQLYILRKNGKKIYSHKLPVQGSCDWSAIHQKIAVPDDAAEMILTVSSPDGKVRIRRLSLSEAGAVKAPKKTAAAAVRTPAEGFELKPDPASFAQASEKRGAALETKDGSPSLALAGKAAWSVKLDPAGFAGKTVRLSCEFKVEGISVKPEKKNSHGFKAQLFIRRENGKKIYSHKLPVQGSCDWSTISQRIAIPADSAEMILSVSIPDGKVWIRRLELKGPGTAAADPNKVDAAQNLVPLTKKPVVDGAFSLEEWKQCAADHSFISADDGMKCRRDTSFFYGADENFFYFCQTSILPPAPQKIDPQDKTELVFLLPDGKRRAFFFQADRRHDFPAGTLLRMTETGKIQVAAQAPKAARWLTEIAVPWSAFGLEKMPEKVRWKMQVRRFWRNPSEIACFPSPSSYLELLFDRSLPMVVTNAGVGGVSARINWTVRNAAAKDAKVQIDLLIKSLEAPLSLNRSLAVAPGGSSSCEQYFMVGGPEDRELSVSVLDSASGQKLYSRTFSWNIEAGKSFIDPDPPILMNFGLAPSQRRLIAKVETADAKKLADAETIRFKVVNADNVLIQEVDAVRKRPGFFFADWHYPELSPGKYTVTAVITRKNGKEETLSRSFQIRNFDWEHTAVGDDRSVPPPFLPLKSSGNRVDALQTGYEAGGVFWDHVFAQGKDILAAPVTLKLNGKTLRKESESWQERAADRAVRISRHLGEGVALEVRHEYEFDGMCKTTLKFQPEKGAKCDSLCIEIPLKQEYARLYHHTASGIRSNPSAWIPAGEGQVWRFVREKGPRYPFYLWFGEIYKGFCHFSDMTPPLFDGAASPVTHEFIRRKDRVILRVHLAPGPTELKPFEYVCGFQPTPVKPRPAVWRRWSANYTTTPWPNTYMMYAIRHFKHYFSSAKLGLVYKPYHNDYSFAEYLFSGESVRENRQQIDARIAAFLKKHDMTDQKWERMFGDGHDRSTLSTRLRHAAIFSRNKLLAIYLNPRAGFRNWAESETYDDEWMSYGFRGPDDNLYHRHPVKSFSDKLLYETREFLRHFPQCCGLNIDNLYPSLSMSPFDGARELAPGKYEFVCDIFPMREMMKRLLRLTAQEKRFIPESDDFPFVEGHMTDANIVPVMGLASMQSNWEMKFGRLDWQDRFPESFHLVQSLGTQTGTIPCCITNTGGSKAERMHQHRTLFAVGFAFDILNFTDPGSREEDGSPLFNGLQKLVRGFGYGMENVEHFPGYEPEKNPVSCTPKQVRITTLKRKDGKIMLLVGNLGDAAKVKLGFNGITVSGLRNAETGAAVDPAGFELAKHDCAVLTGNWK